MKGYKLCYEKGPLAFAYTSQIISDSFAQFFGQSYILIHTNLVVDVVIYAAKQLSGICEWSRHKNLCRAVQDSTTSYNFHLTFTQLLT